MSERRSDETLRRYASACRDDDLYATYRTGRRDRPRHALRAVARELLVARERIAELETALESADVMIETYRAGESDLLADADVSQHWRTRALRAEERIAELEGDLDFAEKLNTQLADGRDERNRARAVVEAARLHREARYKRIRCANRGTSLRGNGAAHDRNCEREDEAAEACAEVLAEYDRVEYSK